MKFNNVNTHSKLIVVLLIVCSILFGVFIVKNAEWTWGDDYEFLISTAIGEIEWDLHIANHGRLYPLGHSDYNILTLIPNANTPLAHYIVVLVSFFLFVYFSYVLYNRLFSPIAEKPILVSWIVFFAIIFLFYYFYRLFFFLVYPERIMVVLFSLFFILYLKFVESKRYLYGVLAILVSIYLSYTKETSFIVFSTLIGVNLIFNFKNLSFREKVFYGALLLNVLVFLAVYYFVAYRTADSFYSRHSTLNEVLKFTFGNLKLLYVATAFSLWRVFVFVFKKDRNNIFVDGLLFSAVLYAIANIVLKMPMAYYYFPAVLLAFPALIYWSIKVIKPHFMLFLLITFSAYYVVKFPKVINNVQDLRTGSKHDFIELTKILNSAEEVYWLKNSGVGNVNDGIIGYQREILDVYYNYFNSTNDAVSIQNVSQLPDSIADNSVILYSELNNVRQEVYEETLTAIDELEFEKQELKNIHEINVFVK